MCLASLRNCLPIFDATCLLYGGLNHVMFHFFCFLFVVSVVIVCGCWFEL